MTRGRSRVLGFLTHNPEAEHVARLLKGVWSEADEHDYLVKIMCPREVGIFGFELADFAQFRINLYSGPLAHDTIVEQNHIGALGGVSRIAAQIFQHSGNRSESWIFI